MAGGVEGHAGEKFRRWCGKSEAPYTSRFRVLPRHLTTQGDGMSDRYFPFSSEEIENEILLKSMVNAFLSWKLPNDFAPDGGISFEPSNSWPTGTNLFTAAQAEAMILHMITAREHVLSDLSIATDSR